MKKFAMAIIMATILLHSCSNGTKISSECLDSGVSKELASFRKAHIKDMVYNLFFSIPSEKSSAVTGCSEIVFALGQPVPVVLDFKADAQQINSVAVNGEPSDYIFENEHIIIPEQEVVEGINSIKIEFAAADQSLNRRDEFLYTLLVPDRARTLFPCMDQPDMKASYNLTLEIPQEWDAIANGPVAQVQLRTPADSAESGQRHGRKLISFNKTEPLSTYLFSFVAGIFEKEQFTRDGRTISIYHRENAPKKAAQCTEIADEVFDSLEWLEEYTAIKYPFAKYDLIILPGFQYGGMEHTGATLYNDTRMFLNEHPTINERLNRSSLIAHETAHMWFGDLVTMKWFDDVWTKEVFANYFASLMIEPHFKEINHRLNFITGYIPAAYSEDRTDGANPIKQELENLKYAGLVYGSIIYDKSPVIMEMLVDRLGRENFRSGIKEYLQRYAYSNATWEELIEILDKYTPEDLEKWSRAWVNEAGMPEMEVSLTDMATAEKIGREDERAQQISTLKLQYRDNDGNVAGICLPNPDGMAYGYFKVERKEQQILWDILLDAAGRTEKRSNLMDAGLGKEQLEVLRSSILITLYENLRRANSEPAIFMEKILEYIQIEENPLLYSLALSYAGDCHLLYTYNTAGSADIEKVLWDIVSHHSQHSFRLQAFRLYRNIAESPKGLARLFAIWRDEKAPEGLSISENDFINLSYTLALNLPERADSITSAQLARISHPDRIRQYKFIAPSVSPSKAVRDSVFTSLLEAGNRRIEPWASTALGYLNHHSRENESLEYIRPALEEMTEVQRTGDIFFPRSWARALLSGHKSKAAGDIVSEFFAENPDYPIMLERKIRQQAWHLRATD